jgi:hypothetical protein
MKGHAAGLVFNQKPETRNQKPETLQSRIKDES